MSLFIEGTAFPLGELNKNGWGVPFSEAGNAISSLKNSVIRICPRDAPHICDIFEDPFAEIGHVVDAWREGDEIVARAEITDSVAAQKIDDGTWETAWSVYSLSDGIDSGGWAHGFEARSMTLVNDPAWEQAVWQIAASKSGKLAVRCTHRFRIVSSKTEIKTGDQVTPDPKDPKNGGSGDPTPTPEEKVAELEQQLAEKDGEIAELKKQAAVVEELSASKADLEKKNREQAKLIASYEKDKAASIPMEKVQELIASKADEVATSKLEAYKEEQKRNTALASLSSIRKDLGLETKPDDYRHLTASDLEKLASDLGKIRETAGVGGSGDPVRYPAGSGGAEVGIYNPVTGAWE